MQDQLKIKIVDKIRVKSTVQRKFHSMQYRKEMVKNRESYIERDENNNLMIYKERKAKNKRQKQLLQGKKGGYRRL